MRRVKSWTMFFEDGVATANASTTGGMGSVSNATVGTMAGDFGDDGSGDRSMVLKTNKSKKGNPSEVSDLRYLSNVEIEVIDDIKESVSVKASDDKVNDFEKDFGTQLDPDVTNHQLDVLRRCFERFDRKFIKGKIRRILFKNLGGVRAQWRNEDRLFRLNPRVFEFKKRFKSGNVEIPYIEFCITHEICHCVDYLKRVSFGDEWRSISGWKKCSIDEDVPEGYFRYVETRPGREKVGNRKSEWISKEGSTFCRKYSSRNPREDFADFLAYAVLKIDGKFDTEQGKRKQEIVKKVLKSVS